MGAPQEIEVIFDGIYDVNEKDKMFLDLVKQLNKLDLPQTFSIDIKEINEGRQYEVLVIIFGGLPQV